METPILYLDDPAEPRDPSALGDSIEFVPLMAIEVLAALLRGEPYRHESSMALIFVDGPPNPEIDEGVHHYCLTDAVVDMLTNIPTSEIPSLAETWRTEMNRVLPIDVWSNMDLAAALTDATLFARRAKSSGSSMFLQILYR